METDMAHAVTQRHMPRRRTGVTASVTIGGERFYLTANGREDETLGEVFIQWGKQGQTGAGLMDIYAVGLSVGLQHGVPLLDLIHQGLDLYFVPNGHTDDPEIPRVRSVVDWVARRLAIDWLPYEIRAAEGIFTVDERVTAAGDWLATEAAKIPAAPTSASSADPDDMSAAFLADLAAGIGTPISSRM
jgi:ribonucleoside-diphosphate reductase alpha chain